MEKADASNKSDFSSNCFHKTCECGKEFGVRSSYYRHRKKCEAVKNDAKSQSGNFVCRETDCDFKSGSSDEFFRHLQSAHNLEVAQDAKVFQKYSDFKIWKEIFERETKASFLLRYTRKTLKGRTEYYYCNRSGNYVSHCSGKRTLKSQGIKKIGFSCPATLRVYIENINSKCENDENETEKVSVTIHSFHYGHDNEIAHLQIPQSDREVIASQLAQGITPSRIIRNIHSDNLETLERKHLCTKRDISNISKKYGIGKVEKHAEDHVSVDMYVTENLEDEKNILLYKRQGDDMLHYPKGEACPLDKNDFVIGIMTQFQQKMFEKFGSNIICMDATHGTNAYDFKLITVLIIDEYREGIPVAWMISNKETSQVLSLFFNHLKKAVGNISPAIFMSDKAPQYFNSWKDTFGGETKKLLCLWHVYHDWQKQLNKIKGKSLAAVVYKALCMLVEESNENNFKLLLKKCCEQLDENPDTQEFGTYFKNEWVDIKEQWAKCYRVGCGINTNMYVESFHKILKYSEEYLKKKHGKRIDKCLSVLLQFSKDLAIKRLIKLEKGKSTWKTSEINKRHRSALKLPTSLVTQTSIVTWVVKSEKSINADTSVADKLSYEIRKQSPCKSNCKVKCQPCNICLHSYSCNCPDALIGANICKHIHLVIRNQNEHVEIENSGIQDTLKINIQDLVDKNIENQDVNKLDAECQPKEMPVNILLQDEINEGENTLQNKDCDESNFIIKSIKPENRDIETIKNNLLQRHMQICEKIKNCNDVNSLLTARDHLNNAYYALGLPVNTFNSTQMKTMKSKLSYNKNVIKQNRFFSTKKKNGRRKNVKYAKPTIDEKFDIEYQLLNDSNNELQGDHFYCIQEIPISSVVDKEDCIQLNEMSHDDNSCNIQEDPIPSTSTQKCDAMTNKSLHDDCLFSLHTFPKQSDGHNEKSKTTMNKSKNKLLQNVVNFLHFFISSETVTKAVEQNEKVEEKDIEIIPENISDCVIDVKSETISAVKQYVTDDAWLIIAEILKLKKTAWTCAICPKVTTKENMIFCDICEKWFHWKCQGVTVEPKQDRWECRNCNHIEEEQQSKKHHMQ